MIYIKIPLFSTPGLTEYNNSVFIANGLPAALKVLNRVADAGVAAPPEVSMAIQLCAGSHGAQTLAVIGPGATSVSLRFHPGSVSEKTKVILKTVGFVRMFEAGDPVEEWTWMA